MSKLLLINSSPRGAQSESLALAETFLASYREANPGAEIERLDLFTADLPVFDGDKTAAKMQVFAGAEPDVTAWGQVAPSSSASTAPTATCSPCRCGTTASRGR